MLRAVVLGHSVAAPAGRDHPKYPELLRETLGPRWPIDISNFAVYGSTADECVNTVIPRPAVQDVLSRADVVFVDFSTRLPRPVPGKAMHQVLNRASARGNNINPHVAYGVVNWYRKRMVAGAPEHTLSIQRARPATKFKLLHLTVCDGRGAAEQKAEFDEWARGAIA